MIPRDTKAGIDRYVDAGVPTGSFLHAVLSNDLFGAVNKADADNSVALYDVCWYVQGYTPTLCHGDPERVSKWLRLHERQPQLAANMSTWDKERREKYYEEKKA